ncbi:MAG: hypothetical protein ACLQQ4_07505 [Bacteroidia bacterium]
MKIFKLLMVTGLAFITAHLSAQENSNVNFMKIAMIQTLNIKNNIDGITSEQASKIFAIEQEAILAMENARNNYNGDNEALRIKMEPIRAERDARIKTVLNEYQYIKYQELEEAHAAKRAEPSSVR